MTEKPMTRQRCPFCAPSPQSVFHIDERIIALWHPEPTTAGHALLITKAHRPSWLDATEDERNDLARAISLAHEQIRLRHDDVTHFDIGLQIGDATAVPHLHIHVIPRRSVGRVELLGGNTSATQEREPLRLLSTGGRLPLLPELEREIEAATEVDVAVAFVMWSGVERLMPYFESLLARRGTLRLLTGDYLDLTDPSALRRLMDLQLEFPEAKVQLRVFVSAGTSFHPKAYILRTRGEAGGTAFVGSSNLSSSALVEGVEWNYRVVRSRDAAGFQQICDAFEELFKHPKTRVIDDSWITAYASRREIKPVDLPMAADAAPEFVAPPPPAHPIQQEALDALAATRATGFTAGLVVMATGLGKTWLSAFDSQPFKRILFVAHRDEILTQAFHNYRRVRPNATFGRFDGDQKSRTADVVFASVQTLGRTRHLDTFEKDAFDYIVIDEFHHASASTYRRIIDHFQPRFLLGLTATPERTDGGDLLALCQENLVYSCGISRGIESKLLSPFAYFGVPDTIDYANIPWLSTRFDEEALTKEAATRARAENALEQWRKRGGQRTLAFCVSQRHANFMREFFLENKIAAAAVHSGDGSDPRQSSLERLANGDLKIIFSVDMFNEGVDVPAIDTVMMLRPTESAIVWLQQFGRGLRQQPGKTLSVIDYIGNHRSFLVKARTLLNVQSGSDPKLNAALQQIMDGDFELPPGCSVTYELEAVNIMRALMRLPEAARDALREYYLDFRERRGARPTASEAFHDGYNPRSRGTGWFGLVDELGDLTAAHQKALSECGPFLEWLSKSEMAKSHEMVLLIAMLNCDGLPGSGVAISALVTEFKRVVSRDPRLRADVAIPTENEGDLRAFLEKAPIETLSNPSGNKDAFFTYSKSVLSFLPKVTVRTEVQALIREITELRLAMYLANVRAKVPDQFVFNVSHANRRPIIFLLDRNTHSSQPAGWVPLVIDGKTHDANFVRIALNVVRERNGTDNELPKILRQWFGPDAGLPGTSHRVVLSRPNGNWTLAPLNSARDTKLETWASYTREQIPGLFGFTFSEAVWNVGFVVRPSLDAPKHVVLLVTLEKGDMHGGFKYRDHFISPDEFEWQSQNRTAKSDRTGKLIKDHAAKGVPVHLFVRKTKKDAKGSASPFVYCGRVNFESWGKGEQPITVRWRLETPAPDRVFVKLRADLD